MRAFADSALGQHGQAVGDTDRGIEACESNVVRQELHQLLQQVARLRTESVNSSDQASA